jgi:hypothetical protein
MLNVGLQILMFGVHVVAATWVALGRWGAEADGLSGKLGIGLLGAWAIAGLVWTPLNARGLWKRRDWARRSSIAYWVIALPMCCCFPLSFYGIWSLRRPSVRALFDAVER